MVDCGHPNNDHRVKGKRWLQAINRALDKRSKAAGIEALDALAEKLLAACDAGDLGALKELGDRLDGRPAQVIGSDPDNPFSVSLIDAKAELSRRLGAAAAAGGDAGVDGWTER